MTEQELAASKYDADWVDRQVKHLSGLAYNYTATGEFPSKAEFTAEYKKLLLETHKYQELA